MSSPDVAYRRAALAVRALWSAAAWRATRNVLAGLAAALLGGLLLGGLAVLWWAAAVSLAVWPVGGWFNTVVYSAAIVILPALALLTIQGLTVLQRSRLRLTLGTEIAAPPRWPAGHRDRWAARLTRIRRQTSFHLLALFTGLVGGLLVAVCWLAPVAALWYLISGAGAAAGAAACVAAAALLLAAPWAAQRLTRADETAARALLGPSHSEELTLRVESLARSRAGAVAAADAERRRIERDLHDGAQQRLVSLAMNLGMAREQFSGESEPVRLAIAGAHDEAVLALAELREFIRGLHPAVLSDRGLDAALSGLVARAPLPVRLRVDVPRPAAPGVEAVAYFIVSEALTNVVKHAQATRAEVTVARSGDVLRITVTDDGPGGAVLASDGTGAQAPAGDGTGLRGLAQRAAAVDGTLSVASPPGGPTVITAELPCES